MSPRTPIGHDLLERLASLEAVDGPAKQLAKAVRGLKAPAKVNEALSGTWLGHPVHPLLIVVPMGSWISAVLLDWLGGEDAETAADLLVGDRRRPARSRPWRRATPTGPTPSPRPTRCAGSGSSTRRSTRPPRCCSPLRSPRAPPGARGRGKLLALAGLGSVGVGGYLGGHLTYAEGVGVNVDTFEEYPQDWTQALADAALGEGEMRSVDLDGVAILIARRGGEVHALSNTCVHRGGSLADGELVGECVQCPLHGSRFRLEDGSVEQGPAAYPQPALEARVRDGSIEVRAPQRP